MVRSSRTVGTISPNNTSNMPNDKPPMTGQSEPVTPQCVQEITDHVNDDGSILRSIVSRHSDGFVCLQLIPESGKPKLSKTIRFGEPETESPAEDLPAF